MLSRLLKITVGVATLIILAGVSAYLTLTLIIRSEDAVVIPELVGKDVVQALEMLSDLGLNTRVKGTEYHQTMAKNRVLFQDPEPGAEIKKGREVRIVISKGPQSVLLPNLVGTTLTQARILLEENELAAGNLAYTQSSRWEKDQVMAQAPAAGGQALRGAAVDLLVSLGPALAVYLMPDFLGLSLDEGILAIERLGMTAGQVTSSYDESRALDTIIDQQPAIGYRAAAGDRIDLTVNRIPVDESRPDELRSTGMHLFRYRLEPGLLRQQVRVRLSRSGDSYDLFDDFAKPGEEIWLLIPEGRRSTLVLYLDHQPTKTELID